MSDTDEGEHLEGLSPVRKRSKKTHLTVEMKEVILNVFKSETRHNQEITVNENVLKVAEKVGVSRASVFKVVREHKLEGSFAKPRTNPKRTTAVEKVDNADKHAIRRKVHQFFFRNEVPTIEKVLKEVNDDDLLPNFKRTTFYKLLKSLNFKWKKRVRNSLLMDREEIIIWRREYLTNIKAYRRENRQIYYLDETWVNAGHTTPFVWVDQTVTSSRQAFLDGLSPGLKNPSGE